MSNSVTTQKLFLYNKPTKSLITRLNHGHGDKKMRLVTTMISTSTKNKNRIMRRSMTNLQCWWIGKSNYFPYINILTHGNWNQIIWMKRNVHMVICE